MPVDPRIAQVTAFMVKNKFTQPYDAEEYIQAADGNHIDYRLLIAISLAESSGCKNYLYNNCWGFGSASGLVHFTSIEEGINYVSGKLSQKPYAGKTDFQIAQIYGPHDDYVNGKYLPSLTYAPKIQTYINQIGPKLKF